MAAFDTTVVLDAIVSDALADVKKRQALLELVRVSEDVHRVLEIVLRAAAGSQHGRDLVVGLIDRYMDEDRALLLSRISLTAGGMSLAEVEETLRDFPEEFTPEAVEARHRRVTAEDLVGVPFRAQQDTSGEIDTSIMI